MSSPLAAEGAVSLVPEARSIQGRPADPGQPELPLEPGETVEYEIDLWSTSHAFGAGHRIRLEVSSSAFPKYNRNLNSGRPIATDTELVPAVNEVWHDTARPSRLILPEIPG
jgi:uncharacterized protein